MFLAKAVVIWIAFVILAIANGAVREKLLVPYLGQRFALPMSGLALSAVIFLTTLAVLPFLGISSSARAWQVGFLWLALTVAFEFLFGHFVEGDSWQTLLDAYRISKGNLWLVVLAIILSAPYLAGKLRDMI